MTQPNEQDLRHNREAALLATSKLAVKYLSVDPQDTNQTEILRMLKNAIAQYEPPSASEAEANP